MWRVPTAHTLPHCASLPVTVPLHHELRSALRYRLPPRCPFPSLPHALYDVRQRAYPAPYIVLQALTAALPDWAYDM